jgi:exonuclease III
MYYIGYGKILNFVYVQAIKHDGINILIDQYKDGNYVIKDNKFKATLGAYIYYGTLEKKKTYGKIQWIYGNSKFCGMFYCQRVDEVDYLNLYKYKSVWQWVNRIKVISSNNISTKLINTNKNLIVMTFNICSSFSLLNKDTGINYVANIILESNADVILLQEIECDDQNDLCNMINKLNKLNKSKKIYKSYPKSNIISRCTVIKEYKRFLYSPVYGLCIKLENGIKCRVFNSHLDNYGFNNLELTKYYQLEHLQIGLYNDIYNKKNDPHFPTILGGDHNIQSHLDTNKDWQVSKQLYKDGWIDTFRELNPKILKIEDATYPNCLSNKKIIENEMNKECDIGQINKFKCRIDYIYSKNGLIPRNSYVINCFNSRKWPSDHNAVVTEF